MQFLPAALCRYRLGGDSEFRWETLETGSNLWGIVSMVSMPNNKLMKLVAAVAGFGE